jgi:hypothetical protein
VPVPAAGLADVLVPELDPCVAAGIEQHLLQEAAVSLLLPAALVQHPAYLPNADDEPVAELLELRQREESGLAAAPGPADRDHVGPRPGRAEKLCHLRLQVGDLLTEGAASGALVRPCRRAKRARQRRGVASGFKG